MDPMSDTDGCSSVYTASESRLKLPAGLWECGAQLQQPWHPEACLVSEAAGDLFCLRLQEASSCRFLSWGLAERNMCLLPVPWMNWMVQEFAALLANNLSS